MFQFEHNLKIYISTNTKFEFCLSKYKINKKTIFNFRKLMEWIECNYQEKIIVIKLVKFTLMLLIFKCFLYYLIDFNYR